MSAESVVAKIPRVDAPPVERERIDIGDGRDWSVRELTRFEIRDWTAEMAANQVPPEEQDIHFVGRCLVLDGRQAGVGYDFAGLLPRRAFVRAVELGLKLSGLSGDDEKKA